MKIYDVSMTIEESMQVYKNKEEKRPRLEITRDFTDSAARESVPPEAARGGSESGGLTRRGPIGTVVRPDCPAPFA